MKNIIKTFGLLAVFSVISGAFAANNQRVGIVTKASPRLPSIAAYRNSTTTTATTTSSTAAYYGVADCVEKYEDCLRAEDVCGSDFQECTTNVLLHAQMPKCSSVLYQCTASGIQQLFGTSSISALSTVASDGYVKDDRGNYTTEVAEYVYPSKNSELNNLIAGAREGNKLTKEQCVRRYTNCLKRDDICGEDFELCTSKREFKKQALLCDSTFARCPTDAKQELFGSSKAFETLVPDSDSRLEQMIDEGAALAAKNAVLTCQKVTDNCLINACTKNPLRCVEGIKLAQIEIADFLGGEDEDYVYDVNAVTDTDRYTNTSTASEVRKMLKAQCLETIGMNKYCHMTYLEKKPTDKDLVDVDLQEEVFALAYSARKQVVNPKLQEAVKKFDTNAKNNCVETIKSCAMRSCGGGLGSVCYRQARTNSVSNVGLEVAPTMATSITTGFNKYKYDSVHINGENTYDDILSGCAAIVNADANCIYAATSGSNDGYVYTYYDDANSTFNTLFPEYKDNDKSDPIGAVATLNALLATSYNDAAIENMKKQCQTIALSCVKSMCGKDYINCYRNRTDIVAGSYDTGTALDRSMNKMGGVLDYNIVQGLCLNTVKNASVCDEHLKVATANWRNSSDSSSWWNSAENTKYTSVRSAWNDANSESVESYTGGKGIIIACGPAENGKGMLVNSLMAASDLGSGCSGTMEPNVDSQGNNNCNGVMDPENGCIYDQPIYQSQSEYLLTNAGKSLFQTLLADVEKEVQAKYNAKLTKEQNVCLANNNGGIMGNTENGSTFMWVKLRNSKVPKNYSSKGLNAKQFVASNDLYGSFCRAKITVLSDDKDIQNLLTEKGGSSVAYFAVGDSFTCGSWIDSATLQKISDTVGERELCKQGYGKWEKGECKTEGVTNLSTKEKIAYSWGTVAPALAGGALGVGLTESGLVGTLLNKADGQSTQKQKKTLCKSQAENAKVHAGSDLSLAIDELNSAIAQCRSSKLYLVDQATCGNTVSASATQESVISAANKVVLACENSQDRESASSNSTARWAIPVATTVAGGALGLGITASVIQAKRENIKNEAAQKWMDEIGEHIQCYLGTNELGTYGDVVSIELD